MNKQWIKLLEDYDGQKAGAIVELESGEAAFLVKSKKAETAEKPAEIVEKTTAVEEAVIERLVAKMAPMLEKSLEVGKSGKRPQVGRIHNRQEDDPTDGFKHMGEFALTVQKAVSGHGVDERLRMRMKADGASENVNADGGYATPVEFATTVFNDIISQQSLLNQCWTMPMNSNNIKLPALNYTQEGQFGVAAYWEGEGQSITPSKPAYRQPQLTLNKLAAVVPVTSELLEDGLAVDSTINFLAGEALTYKINDAIINGSGNGMPTGIVGHASTVNVTRETANEVQTADVIGMTAAFKGNEKNARWYISKRDVTPQLLTLQDANGRYLYFAPGTFGDVRGPANMLGYPVESLINCQPLGTVGDIILWDPKTYVVGYKSTGIQKAMSIHLYFLQDEVAFRWTFRMDGRPIRDTVLKSAKNASNTYSGCVTL